MSSQLLLPLCCHFVCFHGRIIIWCCNNFLCLVLNYVLKYTEFLKIVNHILKIFVSQLQCVPNRHSINSYLQMDEWMEWRICCYAKLTDNVNTSVNIWYIVCLWLIWSIVLLFWQCSLSLPLFNFGVFKGTVSWTALPQRVSTIFEEMVLCYWTKWWHPIENIISRSCQITWCYYQYGSDPWKFPFKLRKRRRCWCPVVRLVEVFIFENRKSSININDSNGVCINEIILKYLFKKVNFDFYCLLLLKFSLKLLFP